MRGVLCAVLGGGAALAAASGALAHPELGVVQEAVEEKLAADPDDPELLLQQSRLRVEARDFDGALVSLAHAALHGANPEAVGAARARVFLEAGFPRMAKLEYDVLLSEHPTRFDLLFERGRATLALGDVDGADRDFSRAIANLSEPRPEHVIVHAQAWLKAGKRLEALRALDAGIVRVGPLPSLQLSAIEVEVELERYDRALTRLDLLLQTTPTNEAWIARRADLLQQAGRGDEARAERARALHQIQTRPAERRSRATNELADRLRNQIAQNPQSKGGLP